MPTTIQVGSGRNQETGLDKLLKGIAIANQGLGVYSNIQGIRTGGQQYDLNKQKLAESERHGRNEFTAQEYAKLGVDVSPIVDGAPSVYRESPIVKNGRTVSPLVEIPMLRGKLVGPDGTVSEVNLINREAVEKARERGFKELGIEQEYAKIDSAKAERAQNRKDKLDAAAKKGTPGQEALDKQYANEFADRVSKGGYADAEKGLNTLTNAIAALGKTNAATGPAIGLVPKTIRDVVSPEGANIQDQVEEVVQRNLRLVLGPQFTEKEGKALIERAYNPRQPEATNIKRLQSLQTQMRQALENQKKADEYFNQNGTLRGFSLKLFKSANDFDLDGAGGEKIINGVKYRKVPGGWEEAQ